MMSSCQTAAAVGVASIAFTDHADFTAWAYPGAGARETPVLRVIGRHAAGGELDTDSYWRCLEECRGRFPKLRILAGVEAGEPHLFAREIAEVLSAGPYERVLGSVHSLPTASGLAYTPMLFTVMPPADVMRLYLAEVLRMIEQSGVFEVLAHIDYPMRAWPKDAHRFRPADFEEEYRAVLRALARTERVLEVNTAGPWPAREVLSWWHEEGGRAVSFGSDAHEPAVVAKDFEQAMARVQAAGFRPGREPCDFWVKQ